MWHRNFNEVNFHSARIAFLNNFNKKKFALRLRAYLILIYYYYFFSFRSGTVWEIRGTARWLHVRGTINPKILDIEVLAVLPFTHYSSTTRIAITHRDVTSHCVTFLLCAIQWLQCLNEENRVEKMSQYVMNKTRFAMKWFFFSPYNTLTYRFLLRLQCKHARRQWGITASLSYPEEKGVFINRENLIP